MATLAGGWARVRAAWRQFRDLLSGEDLADAQQYRSQDLPDWLVPGGSGRRRTTRRRRGPGRSDGGPDRSG